MSFVLDGIGRFLARYLEKPVQGYEPFTPSDYGALQATLQPGDVLLVEGNNHVSGIIKYLTQSTWSHAALYVGQIGDRETADGEPLALVEANLGEGVVGAPLSKYARYHTRICRPTGLTAEDRAKVCSDAAAASAEMAAQDDEYGFGPSDPDHLLGADRTGFRLGALPDPAEDQPRRE